MPPEGIDGLERGLPWVDPRINGILFGWQPEGVPSHRVQDVVASHAAVSADDVGADVSDRMPHMQPLSRGIWEHVEAIEPAGSGIKPFIAGIERPKRFRLGPRLLPAFFDGTSKTGRITMGWPSVISLNIRLLAHFVCVSHNGAR